MSRPNDGMSDSQLEWIRFREDTLGDDAYKPHGSKFFEKAASNPLVPLGVLLTCGALGYGLYSFKKGKARQSQMAMRARIAAQGFTIVAILGGIFLSAATDERNQRKH